MRDERTTDGITAGRRAFLALGAGTVLAGCVGGSGAGSDGGDSSGSTTMQAEKPGASSSASTTVPDSTPTSFQSTPISSVTTLNGATRGTERTDADDESVDIDSNDTFPQTTVQVAENASTDGSATILAWNDAETARRIRVCITTRDVGTPVLETTYRIEADAFVEIEMTTQGVYTLNVELDGDESKRIDFHIDTCNSERITVAVRRDGTVNWEQLSTAMGCSTTNTTE